MFRRGNVGAHDVAESRERGWSGRLFDDRLPFFDAIGRARGRGGGKPHRRNRDGAGGRPGICRKIVFTAQYPSYAADFTVAFRTRPRTRDSISARAGARSSSGFA